MLFSAIASTAALVLAAAVQAKVPPTKQCTDTTKSMIVIEDGLANAKSYLKVSKKISFVVNEDDVKNGTVKNWRRKFKEGNWAVYKLSKAQAKALNKYRKKSKKLREAIRRLAKGFKKSTKLPLKAVVLPHSASSKLVKAFNKRKIQVIKANKTVRSKSDVSSLIKKFKKHNEDVNGIIFVRANKVNAKKLKKLVKKMKMKKNLIRAKDCFANTKTTDAKQTATDAKQTDSDDVTDLMNNLNFNESIEQ